MAFSALAAIAAAVTAASAVGGGIMASNSAAAANKTQAQVANNNQVQARNQQQYLAALNAEAQKRAVAGSVSGRGDTTSYDPATNTWSTQLSPASQRIQNASDQASVSRDTKDLATGQQANDMAMQEAIKAREAAGPALNAVKNFQPMTAQGLEGDLQQTATTANRQAEDPVIADTLRQFARTGTAAGPVLTNMMRDNATSLRQTMLQDKISSMQNVDNINNSQRAGLMGTYAGLNAASHPSLSFSPLSGNSPTDALTAAMTQRATGAPAISTQGGYSTAMADGTTNNAGQFAALHPGVSNLGASIVSGGDQISNLLNSNGFQSFFTNGAGNAGDTAAGNAFGSTYQYTGQNPNG